MTYRLIMDQITHRFEDGGVQRTILNNLSLKVAEGELVAVLGPSGSGKSTFLSIAGALLAPTSGNVLLDGESITGENAGELSSIRLHQIGFIFQSANLIPYLKAEEQLMFVAKQSGIHSSLAAKRARALLEKLGMSHRRGAYPEKLSGGERQRIAIARALMNDPAVLLADEPTASLDAARGMDVVQLLASEAKELGKSAVMVTHDERVLPLCDRVLHLDNGCLIEK
ncbi:putative ABC transport system ATP-binding protein [Paenibacillus cellulosilyticus]|uniref:Putative hemin import ATP-binding protein HrtA n=1 Tax=Paenibacillus cellulosilyticus TaxID=375489 RepID=A0A2V2YTN8_9BACL|nr:ABC transporter ATP-binding protein [Paenibacillus cellulosilyticus]PWW02929.1 putative ABC transport system ATP-binding protein [Paenibacillus cellulosilyticus]QKS45837.1 ABC transporter ATP-binding protein [Paenibacillus cellulosilyticus]